MSLAEPQRRREGQKPRSERELALTLGDLGVLSEHSEWAREKAYASRRDAEDAKESGKQEIETRFSLRP